MTKYEMTIRKGRQVIDRMTVSFDQPETIAAVKADCKMNGFTWKLERKED